MQRSPIVSSVSRVIAGVGLALFIFTSAQAETLLVQPQQLTLSATKPGADLHFRNVSNEETTLSFNVTQWQQEGERDRVTSSTKLMVYPQRVTLKPGDSTEVRVTLRLSGPRWEEEAYQILVTETPRIPDLGVGTDSSEGRIIRPSSVPVFLVPPGSATPRVTWSLVRDYEGAVVLRARNNGRGHVRLHSASLSGPAGELIRNQDMWGILLPGGARTWKLAADIPGGLWQLTASTNAGTLQAELEFNPYDYASTGLTYSQ
ncbi:MAG TPA: fimbria/pilus periplasmic chaperone [Xanthomonadales bacterium]|nr:fimbria/pilus periplasmic chaperone [Xanthomonadales bacterium]